MKTKIIPYRSVWKCTRI